MLEEEKLLLTYLQSALRSEAEPPMSINERSLQIFGNEKFMASPQGQALINRVMNKYHLNKSLLNIYRVYEPFMFVKIPKIKSGNALIVENKDTYGTIRDALLNGILLFGKEFDAVIYGEGRKIQHSFSFIKEPDTELLRDIETFYYIGDIDAEGIDIFNKLKAEYKEYDIRPFTEGYRYMYNNKNLMRKKENQRQCRIFFQDVERLKSFTDQECFDIYQFCNSGYIIPQEVLNRSVIERMAACA